MRYGVIAIAQNEIENFCEDLFKRLNADFEEKLTVINLMQGSFYRQLVTKQAYERMKAAGEREKKTVSPDAKEESVAEKDLCEERTVVA